MFFYKDKDTTPFDHRLLKILNPTACYLKHYENMLYLRFIAENSDDRLEKHQAEKEMRICQRKLDYWARLYNHDEALKGMQALKQKWRK